MAKGKSPGSDGLPMEFNVAFWDLLGGGLVNVFNASLEAGLLPFSQSEALIALIFQKVDRLDHKNWRPISLLNADYKLVFWLATLRNRACRNASLVNANFFCQSNVSYYL